MNKVFNEYIIHEDYAEIKIVGGKFNGTIFTIDIEDVEKCKLYKWYANKFGKYKLRIYGTNPKHNLLLHRFIMDTPDDLNTDHIDGDTLNTRKYNLRICTKSKNNINRKINTNNQYGQKGVFWCWHLPTPKWKAYIMLDKQYLHLGYFEDYERAVEVRLKAEEKYFGEFNRAI